MIRVIFSTRITWWAKVQCIILGDSVDPKWWKNLGMRSRFLVTKLAQKFFHNAKLTFASRVCFAYKVLGFFHADFIADLEESGYFLRTSDFQYSPYYSNLLTTTRNFRHVICISTPRFNALPL